MCPTLRATPGRDDRPHFPCSGISRRTSVRAPCHELLGGAARKQWNDRRFRLLPAPFGACMRGQRSAGDATPEEAPMTKRKTRHAAKAGKSKPARANKAGTTRSQGEHGKPRKTKTAALMALLARNEGASLEELQRASGWQPHSVRGFLAGTVKKMPGVSLCSEKPENAARRYRVQQAAA